MVALGQEGASDPRVINSVKLTIDGRSISARVVDAGDARVEVDSGDWAILKVKENIDLPALNIGLNYQFEFADPIFRLGNDYSKGIVVSTGYVGQRTPNKLVTCLTDGHPGVSGGGVLNAEGRLVGIPVGRMEGDFRFSFILPLRDEMFQKVEIRARCDSRSVAHVYRTAGTNGGGAMSASATVSRHRVVIVGCGFGGLSAAKRCGAPTSTSRSSTGRTTTCSSRCSTSSRRGSSPRATSRRRSATFCATSGTRRVVLGEVVDVDLDARRLTVETLDAAARSPTTA